MRAQVSVEYIMIMILLFAAIAAITVASTIKTREINDITIENNVDALLRKAGNTINTVYLEGAGFTTNITLPSALAGYAYNISIHSNFLAITVLNSTASRALLTNVSGQFLPGSEYAVSNVNGQVTLL